MLLSQRRFFELGVTSSDSLEDTPVNMTQQEFEEFGLESDLEVAGELANAEVRDSDSGQIQVWTLVTLAIRIG